MKINKSLVLTIASAAGTVTTAILSVHAYKKLRAMGRRRTPEKTIQTIAPAVIVGAATIACQFANYTITQKEQKALMAAVTSVSSAFHLYRGEVAKRYGVEVDQEIYDKVTEERIGIWDDQNRGEEPLYLFCFHAPKGHDIFFERTLRFVEEAAYHLNRNYALGGYVSVNDYLEFLNLPLEDKGDAYFWDWSYMGEQWDANWIDFCYIPDVTNDGRPFFSIEFPFDPHMDVEVR